VVCRSVTVVSPAKTAEPIEMTLGLWTQVGRSKHVLHGRAHWRHLANTVEPSVSGGDAAFTLTTCPHAIGFLLPSDDSCCVVFPMNVD